MLVVATGARGDVKGITVVIRPRVVGFAVLSHLVMAVASATGSFSVVRLLFDLLSFGAIVNGFFEMKTEENE